MVLQILNIEHKQYLYPFLNYSSVQTGTIIVMMYKAL